MDGEASEDVVGFLPEIKPKASPSKPKKLPPPGPGSYNVPAAFPSPGQTTPRRAPSYSLSQSSTYRERIGVGCEKTHLMSKTDKADRTEEAAQSNDVPQNDGVVCQVEALMQVGNPVSATRKAETLRADKTGPGRYELCHDAARRLNPGQAGWGFMRSPRVLTEPAKQMVLNGALGTQGDSSRYHRSPAHGFGERPKRASAADGEETEVQGKRGRLPGPGDYDIQKGGLARSIGTAAPAFGMSPKRQLGGGKDEMSVRNPGPGDYSPNAVEEEKRPGAFRFRSAKRVLSTGEHSSIAPGPGQYQADGNSSRLGKHATLGESGPSYSMTPRGRDVFEVVF